MTTDNEPFEFDRYEGFTIESAVHQALGAASVCWENMSGTGVFQSDRAVEIAEALLSEIRRGDR